MTSDSPLITIGMTCYNAADTIGRALQSALAQGWANMEILVVDDASQDESVPAIEQFIKTDPRIRLIRHPQNQGTAVARNTIVEHAKGDFLAFFDDDDASMPDRLRVQYEDIVQYEKNTGAHLIVCYGSGARFYPNGHTVHFRAIGSQGTPPVGTSVADHLLFFGSAPNLFFGSGTPTCSLMARLSVFKTIGPFDPILKRSEDTDFAVRIALQGGHFIGTSQEILHQYSTGGQDKNPDRTYDSYRRLMEKHKTYLQSRGRYYYALAWQKIKFHHFSRRPVHALITLAVLAIRHPLWTGRQFWISAPRRLIHEWKMQRGNAQ